MIFNSSKPRINQIFSGETPIDKMIEDGKKLMEEQRGIQAIDPVTSLFSSMRSAAQKDTEDRQKKIEKITKAATEVGKKTTEAITEPGTLFAKPLLEKAGVNPNLASLFALGIDLAGPGKVRKLSNLKKIGIGAVIGTGIATVGPLIKKMMNPPQEDFKSAIEERVKQKDFEGAYEGLKAIRDKKQKAELRNYIFKEYQKANPEEFLQ